MAITLVGTAQSAIAANGSNITLTFDGSPAQNDVVLLFGTHGDGEDTVATPSGYTEIWSATGAGLVAGAYYKVLGASPDAGVTWNGGGNLADAVAACSFVLRGADTTTPMDNTRTVGTGTSAPPVTPAITTVTDGAWVFSAAYSDATDASVTGPSGYSTPVGGGGSDTNDASVWVAYLEIASAGSEDPGDYSFYGVTSRYYTPTIAVRPAGASSGTSATNTSNAVRLGLTLGIG